MRGRCRLQQKEDSEVGVRPSVKARGGMMINVEQRVAMEVQALLALQNFLT